MAFLRILFERYRRYLVGGVIIILITLGFVALDRLTHEVRYSDVRAAVHGLSPRQIALALGLSAISYLALTFYDVLALRVIGRPLPWRTAALASFSSYTLSHNLGLALLTGGSARYRIYVAAGLDGPDIARVVGIAAAMFWAGVVTIASAALLVHAGPLHIADMVIAQSRARFAGGSGIAVMALLVIMAGRIRKPLVLMGMKLPQPARGEIAAQIAVAFVDITCAAGALFVLLPGADLAQFPAFVLAYAIGIVAALISHVPGGIGIFESVVLAVVPSDRTSLFAALIVYRLIYYLLPLVIGVVLLAWHEGRRSRKMSRLAEGVHAFANGLSPLLLSSATFLGGTMLLLSGSLPAIHARIGVLAEILPLPFIEASHIAASLVGTALLLLSPGLYRRLDGAYLATRVLLLAGAVFSLAKGIDYEEASALLVLAALLHLTRRAFYRKTALTQQPLTAGWMAAIAMAGAAAAWAGLFAYRHVPYTDDLWWSFALHGDAPRYLRATLACAVFLTGIAVWRLLAPTMPSGAEPMDRQHQNQVRTILQASSRTEAMLSLVGDKRFLVSEAGDAFVMYQVKGASWIVMGDPIGSRQSWAGLLWRLRELSHAQQGRLLLYEITPAMLDLAIGLGLQIVKYGEEAIIDLPAYDPNIPALRRVRKAQRYVARSGAAFRIVPAAAVPVILDELEAVSEEWRASKGGQEKCFSLGRFDRAYLCNFDMALVMSGDRIIAFANLWLTSDRNEASVDLMRHRNDAPAGTMDFLFAHLLSWAKERGYRRFTLGVVPLSGIEARPHAPAWAKAAALIFRHGEAIYGFRGLRGYKDKFGPRWEPRYVAGPQGVGLIQALHDVSRLIGGGNRPVATTKLIEAPQSTATVDFACVSATINQAR